MLNKLLALHCQFSRARLDAYIRREMSAPRRQYVARHLRHCQQCRAHYEQRAAVIQELARDIPALGRPRRTQLDHMWLDVKQQIAISESRSDASLWRAGAVVMMFVLLTTVIGGTHTMPTLRLTNDAPQVARLVFTSTPTPTQLLVGQSLPATAVPYVLMLQNTPNTSQSE